MRNKIMIGIFALLAGILIFENAYLLGRYNRLKVQNPGYAQYKPVYMHREREVEPPLFSETRSWDPFAQMNLMQERMNRLFEDSFSGMPSAASMRENKAISSSSLSFSNTGSSYIVKVSMPGIDRNNINIQAQGRQLIISGEKRKDKASKEKNSYSQESSYGNFLSSFLLPEDAQTSRITSDYKDGILTITIPATSKESRKSK